MPGRFRRSLSAAAFLLAVLTILMVGARPASAAAGALDTSFDSDGKLTTPIGTGDEFINAVAVQSDGKIVAAGYTHNSTFDTDFLVVRYEPNGALDTSFGGDGIVTTSFGTGFDHAQAVVIQPDDKIVLAGAAFNGTNDDFALARYTVTGALDTSFDTDGKAITPIGSSLDVAAAMALQPDGKIVLAGWSIVGATYDFALARYTVTGALDTSFDADGKVTTAIGSADDLARAVAVQPDGKIVIAGSSETGTNDDFAVARYTTSGALDPSFDLDGKVVTPIGSMDDFAYEVGLQADGKIVIGGPAAFTTATNSDFALARYTSSGGLDSTFDSDGIVVTAFSASTDILDGLAIQADGNIVAAGYTFTGSGYDFALARYTPTGALDPSFDVDGKLTTSITPTLDIALAVTLQPDGKIIAAGASVVGSTYDLSMVRYLNDAPAISISDASRTEGDASQANMTFTVTVALPGQQASGDVVVQWATADGTATAPADYTARAGTLTFAPGETSKTITVPVKGDVIDEPNETYFVRLSSPTGGVLEDGVGEGTIVDNDAAPAASVSDATIAEGNSGTSYAVFIISLSNPKSETVTVDFETADGTATAPSDYRAKAGTKVFLPGQTIKTVSVAVIGETAQEPNETFFLNLLDPDGATIADGQGVGTITDDDRPVININDASVTEADGTTTRTMTFTVSLTKAGTGTVTVHYATFNGTAVAPGDYTAKSGTLTFSAGQTSKTIPVTVKADNLTEGTETFTVVLDSPTNATIGDGTGVGTINDDD